MGDKNDEGVESVETGRVCKVDKVLSTEGFAYDCSRDTSRFDIFNPKDHQPIRGWFGKEIGRKINHIGVLKFGDTRGDKDVDYGKAKLTVYGKANLEKAKKLAGTLKSALDVPIVVDLSPSWIINKSYVYR